MAVVHDDWTIERPPRPSRWKTRSRDLIVGHAALAVGNPKTPLVDGWQWVLLADIAAMESGHTPSRRREAWWDGDVPWIGIPDARAHNGKIILHTAQHTNEDGLANSAARLLPQGTVCVSRTASIGYVVEMGRPMATSQDFVNWVPTAAVTSSWLRLVFGCGRATLSKFGKGSTHTTIYYPEWMSIHIALPPLVEQHAIVAKVESICTELDDGVAQLEIVKKQLGRYRQATLKAAFEGKLTEEWRNRHHAEAEARGISVPNGEALLEQIRAARQARYVQELSEWEHAVARWAQEGGKDLGRKKPRKPAQPKAPASLRPGDAALLGGLPESWVAVRLGELADIVGGVTKGRKLEGRELVELPYLRVANVQDGYLDLSVVKTIQIPVEETEKYCLEAGDVLYTEGGDRDKLGRGTVWQGELPECIHQNHIFRARPSASVDSRFLAQYSQTEPARTYFFKNARQTVNLASINLGLLSGLPVPLPPPLEQEEVMSEVDARISVIDQIERTVDAALEQASAMRQSVLKRAFEGRLLTESELANVRADPAYEPADRLLARIQERREESENGTPRCTRNSKAATRTKQAIRLPKGERYRQAAVASYAVNRLGHLPTFGRVQQMKFLYLVPHVLEQESHIHAERQAAGPLDPAIHKVESLAAKQEWFRARKSGKRTVYEPGPKIGDACAVAEAAFGDQKSRVDWLLDRFAKFDTEQAELLATTFAVWNDCLIDGTDPSDAEIIAGVHGWHSEKVEKFPEERIAECIRWMRKQNFVPTGTGPKTEAIGGGA